MDKDRRGHIRLRFMARPFLWCAVAVSLVAFAPPASALRAAKNIDVDVHSFLMRIAEGQLFEVSLGQLAEERARNHRIKELAALVVEDHKEVNRRLEQLAITQGVTLSPELRQDDKRIIEQLSKLSGDTFDREYVKYLLQDHEKTVEALEQGLPTVQDGPMKHWMISTIPLLEFHRIRARLVGSALP